MTEVKRSRLELHDYAGNLVGWAKEVLNVVGEYAEVQASGFKELHEGIDPVLCVENFIPWIQHMKEKIKNLQAYLKAISRVDHQARPSTSVIVSHGSELGTGEAVEAVADASNVDSTSEEGEIRDLFLGLSKDSTGQCLEVWWRLLSGSTLQLK